MSLQAKPTLYRLAVTELQSGTQAKFPESASLDEIADVLATDEFLQVDAQKRVEAKGLLESAAFKESHIRLGTKPQLNTFTMFSFPAPNLFGGDAHKVQHGMTLEDEVRAKQRIDEGETNPRSHTVSVWGLPLAFVATFKDNFIARGLWGKAADIVFGTHAPSVAALPERAVTSEMQKSRIAKARVTALDICEEIGLDPEIPVEPRHLYHRLEVPLKPRGYTSPQIQNVKKRSNKLPKGCKADRKHVPLEVIVHILTEVTPHSITPVRPESKIPIFNIVKKAG